MVAVAAAAHTIDALYGEVARFGAVPVELQCRWTEGRTARSARIVETLRLTFRLGPIQATLPTRVQELFKLRDGLVHPEVSFASLMRHPLGTNTVAANVLYAVERASPAIDLALEVIERATDPAAQRIREGKEWASNHAAAAHQLRSYRETGEEA